MDLKSIIKTVPHFPHKGIMFRDITPVFGDPSTLRYITDRICDNYSDDKIDFVGAVESRGFVLAGSIGYKLGKGVVLLRKAGKLPRETESEDYDLEYGKATLQVHKDAFPNGSKVLVVDDLIATGGSARAATNLIEKLSGEVVGCAFVIGLPELGGMDKLGRDYKLITLVDYDGG